MWHINIMAENFTDAEATPRHGASRRRFLAVAATTSTAAGAALLAADPAMAATFARDVGAVWATDYGTIGKGGDDTATLQSWLTLAKRPGDGSGSRSTSLYLPAGTYSVSRTLIQYQSNVILDPEAVIRPTDDFPRGNPLWRTSDGLSPLRRASLVGGVMDCRGIAQGVLLPYYNHFTLTGTVVQDYLDFGVRAGLDRYFLDPAKEVPISYELFLSGVRLHRSLRESWDAECLGLHLLKSTDNEIHDVVIHGAGVGVLVTATSSGTNLSNVHVWGDGATKPNAANPFPAQLPSVCFRDEARGTSWVNCTADSPSRRGFDLQSDSTRLTNCRAFSNWYVEPDTVDAIHVEQTGARISVLGCQIIAIPGHEFRTDIGHPEGSPSPLVSGSNVFAGNTCAASGPVAAGQPAGAVKRLLNVRIATDSARLAWAESSGHALFTKDFSTKTIMLSGDTGAITPGTAAGPGASFFSGSGGPSGRLAGAVGDLYVDKAGAVGKWLYRCNGGTAWSPVA